MSPFTREEAERIIRNLIEVDHDRGEGIDIIYTLTLADGSTHVGQMAFPDERPDSFSIVLDQPPGHTHIDIRWDSLAQIGAHFG